MTWEEYKEANSTIVSMEIDPIMYTIVSKATGIPEENITIYGTIIPVFEESADDGSFVTNILPIITDELSFDNCLKGFTRENYPNSIKIAVKIGDDD